MKKLNKIMLALSILPTLLTSVFLFFMNDTVPMHYNASGAVDRYGSKYENFILPAIILFMYAFYMVYTKIYTKYSTNSVEKINNNVKNHCDTCDINHCGFQYSSIDVSHSGNFKARQHNFYR